MLQNISCRQGRGPVGNCTRPVGKGLQGLPAIIGQSSALYPGQEHLRFLTFSPKFSRNILAVWFLPWRRALFVLLGKEDENYDDCCWRGENGGQEGGPFHLYSHDIWGQQGWAKTQEIAAEDVVSSKKLWTVEQRNFSIFQKDPVLLKISREKKNFLALESRLVNDHSSWKGNHNDSWLLHFAIMESTFLKWKYIDQYT